MAGEIDTLEDMLRELIDADEELEEQAARMIAGLGRYVSPAVMSVVVAIAAGVLRKADDAGMIREIFGSAAPVRGDLEEFARSLMERIDNDKRPSLEAKCVSFVFDMGLEGGKTQTEIAAEEGVGKAAVSKRCINLRKDYGRPPGRGMKTDEARAAYRDRQLGKRAKPERQPWVFAGLFGRALCAA